MTFIKHNAKVLVIDDDATQRMIIRAHLETDGYQVREAENGRDGLKLLDTEPDIRLVITDLVMPEVDGFGVITHTRKTEFRYTYIIVLTSQEDKASLVKAFQLGADDFLTKPVFPDELKLRIKGGERLINLEIKDELIFSMAKLAEYRSLETGYHLERVTQYTKLLGRDIIQHHPELDLGLNYADELSRVSPLHDLGKVAIPDHILHKPGKLTTEEFEVMKKHTVIGGQLLKEIYDKTGSAYLFLAYEIALYHHEHWSGQGYPFGLSGESIPLSARIMMLADVYDALTSDRCYKSAYGHEEARKIILDSNGTQFCPIVMDAFLRQEDVFVAIKYRYREK